MTRAVPRTVAPAARSAVTPRAARSAVASEAPTPATGSQSLERGLAVLELLDGSETPLGVRELARRLALGPAIVQRLLNTLGSRGYVEQAAETRRYRIGPRALGLGAESHPVDQQHQAIGAGRDSESGARQAVMPLRRAVVQAVRQGAGMQAHVVHGWSFPGAGEKKRLNLSATPRHASASSGGVPLRVMLGHWVA